MSLGKYLTNMAVIGSLIGVFGTIKQTQSMPKDWRRIIVWAVWAAGLTLAVVGVAKQPEDEEYEAARKQHELELKKAAKRVKRAG